VRKTKQQKKKHCCLKTNTQQRDK